MKWLVLFAIEMGAFYAIVKAAEGIWQYCYCGVGL